MYANNVTEPGYLLKEEHSAVLRRERRDSPRRRLSIAVAVTIGGQQRSTRTVDVGPRGVFLEYDGTSELWDPVKIEVTPPGCKPVIRHGVVARHGSAGRTKKNAPVAGIGIEFFDDDAAWDRIVASGLTTTSAVPQPLVPSVCGPRPLYRPGASCGPPSTTTTSPPLVAVAGPRLYRIAPASSERWKALMKQFLKGGGIRLRQVETVGQPTPAVLVAVDPETSHEWFLPGTALPTPTHAPQTKGVLFRFSTCE